MPLSPQLSSAHARRGGGVAVTHRSAAPSSSSAEYSEGAGPRSPAASPSYYASSHSGAVAAAAAAAPSHAALVGGDAHRLVRRSSESYGSVASSFSAAAAAGAGAARSPAVWVFEPDAQDTLALPPPNAAYTSTHRERGNDSANRGRGDYYDGHDDDGEEEEEEEEEEGEIDDYSDVASQRRRESERRGRRDRMLQQQHQQQQPPLLAVQELQPWVVHLESAERAGAGVPEAPSPRVLNNRICVDMPPLSHAEESLRTKQKRNATSRRRSSSSGPALMASVQDVDYPTRRSDARVTAPPPGDSETSDEEEVEEEEEERRDELAGATKAAHAASFPQKRGRAWRAPPPAASAASPPLLLHSSTPALQDREAPWSETADRVRTVVSGWDVDGLGPLMVVLLDALPDRRAGDYHGSHGSSSRSTSGDKGKRRSDPEATLGPDAARDRDAAEESAALTVVREGRSSPHSKPLSTAFVDDWAVGLTALVAQESQQTASREVAALHARLEHAEQRVRVAEQQVGVAAEARAAALVQDYKADERRRRAQFQATLDSLREENRSLTAQLEAAARAPALGLSRPAQSSLAAASTAPSLPLSLPEAATDGLRAVTEAGVVRQQVQAVEAYWRDRLRTAERHWEDEMALQTRQRREALDQVDELVRTVEQTQEELRYTRRQAARLREENVRLSSAAAMQGGVPLPSSSSPFIAAGRGGSGGNSSSNNNSVSGGGGVGAVSASEAARLRKALQEHEHREAALLAQVESYGEEATQVRLRYEAALEKARQELEAERRRSTELVKLYGSQLESLHHQLREAKLSTSAPR